MNFWGVSRGFEFTRKGMALAKNWKMILVAISKFPGLSFSVWHPQISRKRIGWFVNHCKILCGKLLKSQNTIRHEAHGDPTSPENPTWVAKETPQTLRSSVRSSSSKGQHGQCMCILIYVYRTICYIKIDYYDTIFSCILCVKILPKSSKCVPVCILSTIYIHFHIFSDLAALRWQLNQQMSAWPTARALAMSQMPSTGSRPLMVVDFWIIPTFFVNFQYPKNWNRVLNSLHRTSKKRCAVLQR